MEPSTPDLFLFNGIDGATGLPLLPPLEAEEVARLVRSERWGGDELEDLKRWGEYLRREHMDVRFGVDSRDLGQAGWGVVFPEGGGDAAREALAPLLALRRAQASAGKERLYRELVYRPGESKVTFLARHGVGPAGPVEPEKLPYFLLLAGSPEEIPFSFQYQLDVQHAVGRLHFDTAAEYARYAETVVATETGELRLARRAAFFAPAHDPATALSLRLLAAPLAEELGHRQPGWTVEQHLADDATRPALVALLGAERPPALAFTAGHGLGFPAGDPRRRPLQGALVCQDGNGGVPVALPPPLTRDRYLAAEDVGDDACPAGLVAFFFACYGAGTPRSDSFAHNGSGERPACVEEEFLSRLPQRLLGHPRGGALAVVGHVDRAWSCSFDWPEAGEQRQVFTSTLGRLLAGYPLGAAMEYFDQRYAELSAALSQELEEERYGARPDPRTLANLWTANNDARSYVVLGDPAVRLAVEPVS